jgi:hypothetical protein
LRLAGILSRQCAKEGIPSQQGRFRHLPGEEIQKIQEQVTQVTKEYLKIKEKATERGGE